MLNYVICCSGKGKGKEWGICPYRPPADDVWVELLGEQRVCTKRGKILGKGQQPAAGSRRGSSASAAPLRPLAAPLGGPLSRGAGSRWA